MPPPVPQNPHPRAPGADETPAPSDAVLRPRTSCPPHDLLELIALGKASSDDARWHIEGCEACRALVNEIRSNEEFLAALRPALKAADGETVGWGLPGSERGSKAIPGSGLGSGSFTIPGSDGDVPGYHNLSEISRGGQGIVYRAVHTITKRKVAIKMLLRGACASPKELHRFEREIEIVAALRHPNIVTVFDSGLTLDKRPFVVMEYIHGLPLDKHVKEKIAASTKRSRWMYEPHMRLFQKIAAAVQHAHARGVIHRDLKPGNILVDDAGEPHIVDFGMARSLSLSRGPTPTMTHEFGGTLAYASPEQVGGDPERIDVRTDVYSLGVILFELLTGHYPYEVSGSISEVVRNIEHTDPTRPSSLEPAIGYEAETIILKALEKDPAQRYQSAGELARDVEDFLDGRPISARSNSTWYLMRKMARRHKGRVVTGGLVGLLLAGCAGAAFVADRATVRQAGVKDGIMRILATLQFAQGAATPRDRFRDVLDAGDKEVNGAFADDPADEAKVRESLGLGYHEIGESAKAEAQFKRILELRERDNAPLAERVALRIQLAEICAQYPANRFEDALKYLDQPTLERVRAHGDRILLARVLRAIGLIERSTEPARALARFEEARAAVLGVADAGDLTDSIDEALADAYLRADENQKALDLYRPLYQKTRARLGDRHLNTAMLLDSVADCEYALGKYEDALTHYELVHDTYTKLLIAPDIRLHNSLLQLAAASKALQRTAEADRFAQQARAMREELDRSLPQR